MVVLLVSGLLVGAVFALRFKVFILVPVTCVALAVVSCIGIAHGEDIKRLVGAMITIAAALQIGYFGGGVVWLVAATNHGSSILTRSKMSADNHAWRHPAKRGAKTH